MPFVRGSQSRGCAFPIIKGREGYWPRRNSAALRRSSIMMILGTYPGERVGEPEFGSRLPELLFEQNDARAMELARRYTVEAIQRWDPLVGIVGVVAERRDYALRIYIDYIDRADENTNVRRATFTVRK